MPDPITLVAVGSVALTEGVKFLYSQAGELLKRWRERKGSTDVDETAQKDNKQSVDVRLPDVFASQLSAPQIHYDALELVEEELRSVRKELSEYVEGIEKVDVEDKELITGVDILRRLMEAVYKQRITFKGEVRAQSGPTFDGRFDAIEIAGDAAVFRIRKAETGSYKGEMKIDNLKPGGRATVFDLDEAGS